MLEGKLPLNTDLTSQFHHFLPIKGIGIAAAGLTSAKTLEYGTNFVKSILAVTKYLSPNFGIFQIQESGNK